MDYIGVVQIVQAQKCLVEGGHDKSLLEDIVLLQFLQGSETHSKRRHYEDFMLTMGAAQLECVSELPYMLPTRVIQVEAG